MTKDDNEGYLDIKNCARCNNDHDKLLFVKLKQAADEWTHYATCPTTQEPVMAAFVDD